MSTIEQALKKQQEKLQKSGVEPVKDDNQQVNNASNVIENKVSATNSSNEKHLEISEALLTDKDFIVAKDVAENRILKEEFRQIKRKLLNNAFGVVRQTLDNPNLVMITSARPNEGKTFISINLALSIALEQDKTVLLVDADILKPSILKEFGLKPKPGLIDYLMDSSVDISDIIYTTNIDNLRIIPAGQPHHLANELLASERMASLTNELASRYSDRMVIFDSPPLLGINETSILSHLMGQALIAVEENKTNVNDVIAANSMLREELAKGVVLNKAFHSRKETYGYYGYGYGTRSDD